MKISRKYAKVPNKADYISITDAAYMVGVSPVTIKRWVKWWESDEFKKPEELELPPYYILDEKKTKYFKQEDIKKLKEFKIKLQTTCYGCMAEFNTVYQYGKRGKEFCKKRGINYNVLKNKIK